VIAGGQREADGGGCGEIACEIALLQYTAESILSFSTTKSFYSHASEKIL